MYKIAGYLVTDEEYNNAQKIRGYDAGEFDLGHMVERCTNEKSSTLILVKNWISIMVKHGYMIEAIKIIRFFFNDGLKDCRDITLEIQEKQNNNR